MIHITESDDGVDIDLDRETAGYLLHLIGEARLAGTATIRTPKHTIRVHVHATAAPAAKHHKAIDEVGP